VNFLFFSDEAQERRRGGCRSTGGGAAALESETSLIQKLLTHLDILFLALLESGLTISIKAHNSPRSKEREFYLFYLPLIRFGSVTVLSLWFGSPCVDRFIRFSCGPIRLLLSFLCLWYVFELPIWFRFWFCYCLHRLLLWGVIRSAFVLGLFFFTWFATEWFDFEQRLWQSNGFEFMWCLWYWWEPIEILCICVRDFDDCLLEKWCVWMFLWCSSFSYNFWCLIRKLLKRKRIRVSHVW